MTQVTRHDVDVGDVILHCITAGKGFPVVLVHGSGPGVTAWRMAS